MTNACVSVIYNLYIYIVCDVFYYCFISQLAYPSWSLVFGHKSLGVFSFVKSLDKLCDCVIILLDTSSGTAYYASVLLSLQT